MKKLFLRSNGSSDLRASSAAVLVLGKLARGIKRKVAPVISRRPKRGEKKVTTALNSVEISLCVE